MTLVHSNAAFDCNWEFLDIRQRKRHQKLILLHGSLDPETFHPQKDNILPAFNEFNWKKVKFLFAEVNTVNFLHLSKQFNKWLHFK